jgi:hypothetical protein
MQTDSTIALGVVNNNVMKQLKAMDMKYHWLRCRINQCHLRHYWAAGKISCFWSRQEKFQEEFHLWKPLRESLVLINCELRNINFMSLKTTACTLYSHTPSETKKN